MVWCRICDGVRVTGAAFTPGLLSTSRPTSIDDRCLAHGKRSREDRYDEAGITCTFSRVGSLVWHVRVYSCFPCKSEVVKCTSKPWQRVLGSTPTPIVGILHVPKDPSRGWRVGGCEDVVECAAHLPRVDCCANILPS